MSNYDDEMAKAAIKILRTLGEVKESKTEDGRPVYTFTPETADTPPAQSRRGLPPVKEAQRK